MLNASEIAKGVVDNWVTSQLRPEGRAGIYTDDEIVLQIEISEAIETAVLAERERWTKSGDGQVRIVRESTPNAFESTMNGILSEGLWRVCETEMSECDHQYTAMLVRGEKVPE